MQVSADEPISKQIVTSSVTLTILKFQPEIVGVFLANNKYGQMNVQYLNNKSLVLSINHKDQELANLFKGKIVVSDEYCNVYIINVQLSNELTQEEQIINFNDKVTKNNNCTRIGNSNFIPRALQTN